VHAQQLPGICFGTLAGTESKADDMDPIAVNNNELALEEKLHFQANVL